MKIIKRAIKVVSFTVPGEPVGWQRAGQNRLTGATYTQAKTRGQEQLIADEYYKAVGAYRFPKGAKLELIVKAYMKVPASARKSEKEKMLSGKLRPTKKPDWDNIGKLVSDALNGIAYEDDKAIVSAIVSKFYADKPRTFIVLQSI